MKKILLEEDDIGELSSIETIASSCDEDDIENDLNDLDDIENDLDADGMKM